MKVCFYHQPFDVDVSSGTEHARHQWHELLVAFGVTECAVINETDDEFKSINDSVKVTEYRNLVRFIDTAGLDNCVFVEQGANFPIHHECGDFSGRWIVIGGANGLPFIRGGFFVKIDTPVALYPRQAAAIVLEAQWRLR